MIFFLPLSTLSYLIVPSSEARKQAYEEHENQLPAQQPMKREWLTLPEGSVWIAWLFTRESWGLFLLEFVLFSFEKSTCTWEWTNCMSIALAGKLTMGRSFTGRAQISRKKFNKAFYWDVCVCLEFCACLVLFQFLGGLFYVTELLPEDSKIIE